MTYPTVKALIAAGGRVEETGLWFEDFRVGATYETGSRKVSAEDVAAFAAVSGDRNPLHVDASYAAATVFGRVVAHGALGFAVATGLLNERGLTRGTLVAFVGMEWSFDAPLYPGSEVRLRVEVAGARPTSNPERGLVTLRARLVDAGSVVVQGGELRFLVRRRGAGATTGAGGGP